MSSGWSSYQSGMLDIRTPVSAGARGGDGCQDRGDDGSGGGGDGGGDGDLSNIHMFLSGDEHPQSR